MTWFAAVCSTLHFIFQSTDSRGMKSSLTNHLCKFVHKKHDVRLNVEDVERSAGSHKKTSTKRKSSKTGDSPRGSQRKKACDANDSLEMDQSNSTIELQTSQSNLGIHLQSTTAKKPEHSQALTQVSGHLSVPGSDPILTEESHLQFNMDTLLNAPCTMTTLSTNELALIAPTIETRSGHISQQESTSVAVGSLHEDNVRTNDSFSRVHMYTNI